MAGIFDAVLAAATIGSGIFAASSASKAAGVQAGASDRAVRLQQKQYKQTRKDLAPWREAGGAAITELSDLYGLGDEGAQSDAMDRFFTTPGYEFRLGEGINALEKSAAARGTLNSGRMGRELVRYGQGVASAEFGNYANRLSTIAGVGQTATGTTAQAGANAATNAGQFMANAGEARASGYAGVNNALSGTVENLLYLYGQQNQGGQWMNPDTNRLVTWG